MNVTITAMITIAVITIIDNTGIILKILEENFCITNSPFVFKIISCCNKHNAWPQSRAHNRNGSPRSPTHP